MSPKPKSYSCNLIPHFIADRFKMNQSSGSFHAATMFLDISGFTAMTQTLMVNGKEGAEVLNNILSKVFEPVVAAVYQRGGFISSFEGDAFTALFPTTTQPLDACRAAVNINQTFKELSRQETRFGTFDLSVKIGLGFGKVSWGIVGSADHQTWFFRGQGIQRGVKAEKKCSTMQILLISAFSICSWRADF